MTSVVVADDHPLMLDAVAGVFSSGGFQVVARCVDGLQAREAILQHRPDLAVLDIHMPRLNGLDLLRDVRQSGLATRVLLLTAGLESEAIVEALGLDVNALVLKGAAGEVLIRAAKSALAGEPWIDPDALSRARSLLNEPARTESIPLTSRETQVVRCIARGLRNKEIARDLSISEGTVKMHLHNLYEKLSVTSRTELAILVRERKLHGW